MTTVSPRAAALGGAATVSAAAAWSRWRFNQPLFEDFEELEKLARRRIPRDLFSAFGHGADLGETRALNESSFREISFRPRAATRASVPRDLSTTVLGTKLSFPVLPSSMGSLRAIRPDGVLAIVRAAGAEGAAAIVGTSAGHSAAEAKAAASGPLWFQSYWWSKRITEREIGRAAEQGYQALVMTVDCPYLFPKKQRATGLMNALSLRSALQFGPQLLTRPNWTANFVRDGVRTQLAVARKMAVPDPSVPMTATWEELEWVRERWAGPLILKGITRVEDAKRAVAVGADGISVSNHGGFVMDGIPPTVRSLPAIVDGVGDQVDVFMDGGIRHGSDVVKAIALGAKAVFVGSPMAMALAAAGEAGVRKMLTILREEMDSTMATLGASSVHELDRSWVGIPQSWARD